MRDLTTPKVQAHKRRKARRALVQAIYQWQMNDAGAETLLAEFHEGKALAKADNAFFDDILGKVIQQVERLDAAFSDFLDRDFTALDQVELAVMRLGTCELINRPDVPYRVVIDEYVELTKVFGAEQSHRYVNGVLDKVAGRARAAERGVKPCHSQ